MIALQVVRTSFGFHLRECMGSCFPPPPPPPRLQPSKSAFTRICNSLFPAWTRPCTLWATSLVMHFPRPSFPTPSTLSWFMLRRYVHSFQYSDHVYYNTMLLLFLIGCKSTANSGWRSHYIIATDNNSFMHLGVMSYLQTIVLCI